jgi:hypothetical protein
VSVTAYHSFAGEVEASNTPTIRRLTLSRRHQLSPHSSHRGIDNDYTEWEHLWVVQETCDAIAFR